MEWEFKLVSGAMQGRVAPRHQTSHQTYQDFNDLFQDVNNNIDNNNNQECHKFPLCPRVLACIQSVPIDALVDTGSQITAVSEIFCQYLKKYNKIVELPVSNVALLTAIGRKPTTIKKQILCDIQINGYQSQSYF